MEKRIFEKFQKKNALASFTGTNIHKNRAGKMTACFGPKATKSLLNQFFSLQDGLKQLFLSGLQIAMLRRCSSKHGHLIVSLDRFYILNH